MGAREDAIALYNQARTLEATDTTGYTEEEKNSLLQEVIDLLSQARSVCPHIEESKLRRSDLDVPGIITYECGDCHNLNYIQED